jgi:hypothetical protein
LEYGLNVSSDSPRNRSTREIGEWSRTIRGIPDDVGEVLLYRYIEQPKRLLRDVHDSGFHLDSMLSIIRDRYHSATQATQNATNKVRRQIVSALPKVVVFHFRSAELRQQGEVPREVRIIRKLSEDGDGAWFSGCRHSYRPQTLREIA